MSRPHWLHARRAARFGLAGLFAASLAACGGTLTLESEPGDGMTVVIAIPLNAADEPPAHAPPAA